MSSRSPIPTHSPIAAQIVRFLGAGGLATLLHWGVMGALMLCEMAALLATTVGAMAGALGNYGLQSRWVFANPAGPCRRRMTAYLCTLPLGWCANAAVFAALATHVPIWLAQLGAHSAVATLNFVLYRSVVFHERVH